MSAESSIGNNLQGESNKTAPGAIPAGGHYESQDQKSRVKLVRSDRTGMEKGPGGSYLGDNSRPVLIVGFPGVGLVGSISSNYIIEKKNMHQIAFVDSEYVVPSAIYIGGKLRHPFRIYADSEKTLCVIVCEAPLMPQGVHSIMGLLVDWASKNHIKEVLVLDGVPVKGLPAKNREPLILSSSNSSNPQTKEGSMRSAMMVGLSGGLISACISDDMPCTGVLIHSTSGVPDPEGAAILLDTISQVPSVPLEIDTEPLRKQGQEIKRQLKAFIDSVQREQGVEGRGRYLKSSRIYG
jgi:uncharacterized protein